jgi:glyoxylase I family protein
MQVEHIAWQVQDPALVAAWYETNFGFTVLRKFKNASAAHFLSDAVGRVVLEIYNHPKATVPDYHSIDPLHLHLAFRVDDPSAVRDRLVAAGSTVVDDLTMTPAGDELIMMRDPWGFPIQLVKRASPFQLS